MHVSVCGVTEESVKYCAEDGSWFSKSGLEWTDYTPCVDKQVHQTPSHCVNNSRGDRVCLPVHLLPRISQKPHGRTSANFLHMLPVTLTRFCSGSVEVC